MRTIFQFILVREKDFSSEFTALVWPVNFWFRVFNDEYWNDEEYWLIETINLENYFWAKIFPVTTQSNGPIFQNKAR